MQLFKWGENLGVHVQFMTYGFTLYLLLLYFSVFLLLIHSKKKVTKWKRYLSVNRAVMKAINYIDQQQAERGNHCILDNNFFPTFVKVLEFEETWNLRCYQSSSKTWIQGRSERWNPEPRKEKHLKAQCSSSFEEDWLLGATLSINYGENIGDELLSFFKWRIMK